MNKRQAYKFWNNVVKGEVIGFTPDSSHCQGGEITKPTYLSTICDQLDLKELSVPYFGYVDYIYPFKDEVEQWQNPNSKAECKRVAEFLRMLADQIDTE
ncbi:hypothetical protein NVP1084O_081 [Vibrio phage 1.084.O._10N.261.49.F5]|nr:hypothetical protein NVP1084O_081 [Vibrio phage 1.084.O._10N.261.49.F5]